MNRLYNHLFKLSCSRAHRQFVAGISDYQAFQEAYLKRVLRQNANCVYGRRHRFADMANYRDFQAYVPLTDYDTLRPDIARQMATAEAVLTTEPAKLYEPSSGSTAPSKYIPYTAGLQADYMQAVKPWLYDLYCHIPQLTSGRAYWSISPIDNDNRRTTAGVPIGFADDTGYFDSLQSRLLERLFVVPGTVKHLVDITDFRYLSSLFLLAADDLSYVSVWNPSFFTLLLKAMVTHGEQLVADVADGTLTPPNGSMIPDRLAQCFQAKPQRAKQIAAVLSTGQQPMDYARLWPKLALISCWDQSHAKSAADDLKRQFPGVALQGKGLLATEGVVSIPLMGIGKLISYRSHFYEFIPYDTIRQQTIGDAVPLWQLERGQYYSVVLTTRGGLYRYQLGDIVYVSDFYKGLAVIDFVAKRAVVCDLVGEKLNAEHVSQLLADLIPQLTWAFLAPVRTDDGLAYCLFAYGGQDVQLSALTRQLEAGLQANYHYRYARDLGQLQPLKCFRLISSDRTAYYDYIAEQLHLKLGDIKDRPLWPLQDFATVLAGRFVDEESLC